MIVELCPSLEELRRLIEERLGPVREAAIEAHVEDCPDCQGRLARLTARRPWDERDTQEAAGRRMTALPDRPQPRFTTGRPGLRRPRPGRTRRRASPWEVASWTRLRDRPRAPVSFGRPVIAGYEIQEKIGEGGMGVVYLGASDRL